MLGEKESLAVSSGSLTQQSKMYGLSEQWHTEYYTAKVTQYTTI